MLSLKSDQNDAMNNINALLNNKDTEKDLISNIKANIGKLSLIHNAMQETEAFIVQLTANDIKLKNITPEDLDIPTVTDDASKVNIGSGGVFNDKDNEEKSEKW